MLEPRTGMCYVGLRHVFIVHQTSEVVLYEHLQACSSKPSTVFVYRAWTANPADISLSRSYFEDAWSNK